MNPGLINPFLPSSEHKMTVIKVPICRKKKVPGEYFDE